jgi:release factor glutamine methyltransferase
VTIGEALRASTDELERAGVDSPRLDAELLLGRALRLSRLGLYAQADRSLTDVEAATTRGLIERRYRREPLAYVLGEWGFRRLTLRTDPRALVPRPETEVLVERALARMTDIERPRALDVGTGSGAIALALADERPDARVTATDVSDDALALARENAERLGLDVELVHTSLLDGLAGPFDLVVSNPPYVLANEELPPELAYEPREALIEEGHTEQLLVDAQRVLHGWLLVETHSERANEIAALARDAGYAQVAITRDLAGRDRVVEARWTS